jgi:ribose transport system substrate-binding protein
MRFTQAKRWLCLILALLFVAATAGCGTNTPSAVSVPAPDPASTTPTPSQTTVPKKEPKDMKIVVLMASFAGYAYTSAIYGILEEAKALGVPQPQFLQCGGYEKVDVQIKQIEDAVASGADAIILYGVSDDALNPALEAAVAKGVYIVQRNHTNFKKSSFEISLDFLEVGKMLAEYAAETLNKKGNIVIFCGPAGASWSVRGAEGYHEVLKNYPDIKILGERWSAFDTALAMNTMNDFLQSFDNIDLVISISAPYTSGAAAAIEAAGKTGQIKIVAQAVDPEVIELMRQGKIDVLLGNCQVKNARRCLDAAVKLIQGETLEENRVDVPPTVYKKEEVMAMKDPTVELVDDLYPAGWTIPIF